MQNPFDKFDAVESNQPLVDLNQARVEDTVNVFDQFDEPTVQDRSIDYSQFDATEQLEPSGEPQPLFFGDIIPNPTAEEIREQNQKVINNTVDLNADTEDAKFLKEVGESNSNRTWKLARARFSPEQLKAWENNPIGFSEARRFMDAADVLPGGGVVKGAEALAIGQIANKMRLEEKLTPEETNTFNKYIDLHVEQSVRGFSWGGGMMYYGAPIPAFMAEIALTAGIGKTAQMAATGAITKGVMVAAETVALAKYSGYAARVAAQSVAMVPMTTRNYGEGRLGQNMQLTEAGQVVLLEAEEKPVSTALKALAYTGAEMASELSGGKLGQHVIDPVLNRVATSAGTQIAKLNPRLVDGLINAYKKIKPNAKISELFSRAGWHGMINELGEERVSDILKVYVDMGAGETFTTDEVWDRVVPSKDQFLIEAGLVGTIGAVRTGASAVANILAKRGISESDINAVIEGLSNEELEAFISDEIYMETNPSRAESMRLDAVENLDKRFVADQELDMQMINDYEANNTLSLDELRNKQVDELAKQIALKTKAATKFRDWIAEGGALNVPQLKSMGIDPAIFVNKKLAVGKGLKRVFAQNGTQSLSSITERWNEENNLVDMSTAADKDRALSDTEMLGKLQDWFYSDNPAAEVYDPTAKVEIDAIQKQSDDIERLDESELEEYYNEIYRLHAQQTDTEMPVETESSIDGGPIEYAQTIDQAEFNQEMADFKAFVDAFNEQELAENYGMKDLLYDDFISDQEKIDNVPDGSGIDNSQSIFRGFYAAWVNKFDAVDRVVQTARERGAAILPGTNTTLLASAYSGVVGNIKKTLQQGTYFVDAKGNNIDTGEGLKGILEGFDTLIFNKEPDAKVRRADLIKYLIAKRTQQDLQNYTLPGTGQKADAAPTTATEIAATEELTQDFVDELSVSLQKKYELDASQVIIKSVDGNLFAIVDANINQEFVDELYSYADSKNVEVTLALDQDARLDGKNPQTLDKFDFKLGGSGAVYEQTIKPSAPTKVPELAGPPKELVGAVQPAFTKDKKFVGPVQERRVSEEQAFQAELDLYALEIKYGDSIVSFDSTGTSLYEFQKRVMALLVQSGNMSQQQFDDIISANTAYIPFQRVMLNDFLNEKGLNDKQIRSVLSVLTDSEIQDVIDTQKLTQDQYDRVLAADPKSIDLLKPLTFGSGKQAGLFNDATSRFLTQKLTGSDRAIKDPINSIISNVSKMIDTSSRNRIARSLVNLADFIPESIVKIKPPMDRFIIDGKEVLRPSKNVPKNTVIVYVDGKKQFYKVSAPILKAMNGLDQAQLNWLEKFFIFPSTVFRTGATMMPDFVVKNVIRDTFGAFAQSEARPTPIDTAKGLASIMGDQKLADEWRASGGSMGTYMDLSDTGLVSAQKDLMGEGSSWYKYLNPAKPFMDVAQVAEQSVRIGVFNAAKRKGMSDIEAAFESRQATVDFMRSGSMGKEVNRYLPFFNAAIQGTDKLIRAYKKNPKAMTAIFAATITLPSLLISGYYLYGAPDDEREEYLNLPEFLKNTNWVFKVGDTWVPVPKPFAPGYIYGSIPEKFMTWMYEGDKPQGKSYWEDVLKPLVSSVSPIVDVSGTLPPWIKMAIEQQTNFNFFQDRAAYPDYLDDLEPELRKGPGSSLTAVALGEKFNISPYKIDTILQQTLAGTAKYVTGAGDLILQQTKDANTLSNKPTSFRNNPLIKSFIANDPIGPNSKTVSNFYEIADIVKIAVNSVKEYTGKKEDSYRKNNEFIFNLAPAVRSSVKRITKINKLRREVRTSLVLSGDAKAKELKLLDKKLFEVAKDITNRWDKELVEYERKR